MAIHHEDAYAPVITRLNETDAAAREVLMLPLFAGMTDEQHDYVLDRLAEHVVARAA